MRFNRTLDLILRNVTRSIMYIVCISVMFQWGRWGNNQSYQYSDTRPPNNTASPAQLRSNAETRDSTAAGRRYNG